MPLNALYTSNDIVDNQQNEQEIHRGGYFDIEPILSENLNYDWGLVPENWGDLIYSTEILPVNVQYGYYKQNLVMKVDIFDQNPILGNESLPYSEQIVLLFDENLNDLVDEGDFKITYTLGINTTEINIARHDGQSFIPETIELYEIIDTLRYLDDHWELQLRISILPQYKTVGFNDTKQLFVSYRNYVDGKLLTDIAFDEFAETGSFSSTLPIKIEFPPLLPEILVERAGVPRYIDRPYNGRVELRFTIISSSPIYNFQFTERSPVRVQSFTTLSGVAGSIAIQGDSARVKIFEVPAGYDFSLIYYLGVDQNTEFGNYSYPELHVEYNDVTGKSHEFIGLKPQSFEVVENLDDVDRGQNSTYSINTNLDANRTDIITTDFTDYPGLTFIPGATDTLFQILRYLGLFFGTLFAIYLVRSFFSINKAKRNLQIYENQLIQVPIKIAKKIKSKDEEFVKSFLRLTIDDAEVNTKELKAAFETRPPMKNDYVYMFGKYLHRVAERVEIFFEDTPEREELYQIIAEARLVLEVDEN